MARRDVMVRQAAEQGRRVQGKVSGCLGSAGCAVGAHHAHGQPRLAAVPWRWWNFPWSAVEDKARLRPGTPSGSPGPRSRAVPRACLAGEPRLAGRSGAPSVAPGVARASSPTTRGAGCLSGAATGPGDRRRLPWQREQVCLESSRGNDSLGAKADGRTAPS